MIPFKYDATYSFAEDGSYAVVEKNGLYGMIDKKGNWILKPKFVGFIEKPENSYWEYDMGLR